MTEFWETAFTKMQLAWGLEPTGSACLASDYFARAGVKDVLIPGIGYGRNAKPFLECGMSDRRLVPSQTIRYGTDLLKASSDVAKPRQTK